VQRYLKRDQRV
jgi:RNA recognition motif-containing protein